MTKEHPIENDEELVDNLITISVISKQLPRKIKEDEPNEPTEETTK